MFTCARSELTRTACKGEGFFREHEGNKHCVLHYPSNDKSKEFNIALQKKLKSGDFNFRGIWFPNVIDFEGMEFNGIANFHGANFNANAYFGRVKFSKDVDFSKAVFSANVYFHKTDFSSVVNFYKATFEGEAYFGEVTFRANVSFREASFKDYVRFIGSEQKKGLDMQANLDLQFAHIEKPDRISFHMLRLRPRWFINTDPRKFEFIDIAWPQREEIEEELADLSNRVTSPHRLMAITYRHLAINAEENHRYNEASRFRYTAFEMTRVQRFYGFIPWRLDWWYWLASGYGERVGRALLIFVILIASFAFGYTHVEFEKVSKPASTLSADAQVPLNASPPPDDIKGEPLGLTDAIIYSGFVSVLRTPDPKPLNSLAKILVLIETVLGPAQIAMIALAVRRKFMR
jgi:uncharacterized protein YjbI with pentapeptide repeats